MSVVVIVMGVVLACVAERYPARVKALEVDAEVQLGSCFSARLYVQFRKDEKVAEASGSQL